VILMRKDPPFDMEYIYTTFLLERAEEHGALVVNKPRGAARRQREGLHDVVPGIHAADHGDPLHGRTCAASWSATGRRW
jgi:hypothetical protein